jgi:hypothetical protein
VCRVFLRAGEVVWLSKPVVKGQKRNDNTVRAVGVAQGAPAYFWSVAPYENRWDLIEEVLEG